MYLLARVFPALHRLRLPFSRDQALLLLLAAMQVAIAVEVATGHMISGSIVPNEWIPIVFGPLAGGALLIAVLCWNRSGRLAAIITSLTCLCSIIVGLLGTFFHLRRALAPGAPPGEWISLELLVWGPPVMAPLMFVLIGVLGLTALVPEDPPDSGTWYLPSGRRMHLPWSKTRLLFLWVSMAMLATVVSSVLDHARAGFANPWLWVPTVLGLLSTVVTAFLVFIEQPSRGDLVVYLLALALITLAGPVGTWLHIRADLGSGPLVWERLLKGAPVMAPLLFSNMGILGLLVLLNPLPLAARTRSVPTNVQSVSA